MERNCLKTGIMCAFCLMSLSVALTSCSSDGDEPEGNENGRKLRQLTISEVPITRATLTDNSGSLGAAWKAGDKATLVNVSAIPSELLYGYFTATSNAVTSSFTGSIFCEAQDKLALIYPKVEPQTGNGTFTINLSGQKGTLDDVATNYHYVYGVGEVTSATKATATATISPMKSLLAVAKFMFKDKETDAAIPVKTLKISYGDALSIGYPQSATVEPKVNPDNLVLIKPEQEYWSALTVTLDNEISSGVYVALLPCGELYAEDFFFSVTTANEVVYTGTASATLKAGKYYPVTLKLTKQ